MLHWTEDELIQRVGASNFSRCNWTSPRMYKVCPSCLFSHVTYGTTNSIKIMLGCRTIIRGTSKEIVKTLETYVKTKALAWIKCVRARTDGGRAMCGKNSSRPTVTQVHEVRLNVSWTHCNNHREVFISKTMFDEFKSILNIFVKIVNFTKSRPLQWHLFEELCKQMGSIHKSPVLHTEVRWLSRGESADKTCRTPRWSRDVAGR